MELRYQEYQIFEHDRKKILSEKKTKIVLIQPDQAAILNEAMFQSMKRYELLNETPEVVEQIKKSEKPITRARTKKK